MDMSDEQKPVTDLFEERAVYEPATTGQRFVNFLVDNLLMRFALSWVSGSVVGILLARLAPDFARNLVNDRNGFDLLLLGYLISILNYLFYYTICEKAFRGYTLGKLITGTRAIRNDGRELLFTDALLRTLSRMVPLEPFSGFGAQPWHDSWTRTMVIKAR